VLGYVFATNYPAEENWYQSFLSPALNYACTGHFGPLRLAENAPADDIAAMQDVDAFLHVRRLEFSCRSFPRNVVATSVFDGIASSNVEQPLYLMLSYGVLWRWLGPNWWVSHYVIAALVAMSFLLLYVATQRLMPPLLAASAILIFLASPIFIRDVLSPRDALKFPFVVGITALLIGYATMPRTPLRFVAFAAGLGLLIGIGYGFRSDLMLFVAPAAFIVAVLGRVRLDGVKTSWPGRALANVAVRAGAIGTLLVALVAGAWLPLLNDYYLNPHNRNVPYHSLAAGLYGVTNYDLVQSHDAWNGMYMFRNSYANDLGIGVRVLEYASRRYGDDSVRFAHERYWTYAKEYYLDVVRHIPADMVSGMVGAFVNLMTVPASTQRLTLFDNKQPWSDTYGFARGTWFFRVFVQPMDLLYRSWRYCPEPVMLVLNLLVTYAFFSLIALRFGVRAAAAAMVVFGTIVGVISLRFEMRHTFYIYALPIVAWGSAAWLAWRFGPLLVDAVSRRRRGIADDRALAVLRRRTGRARIFVAVLGLGILASVYLILTVARSYQATELRALITDWLKRTRMPLQFDTADAGEGRSIVRVRSSLPTSTGGRRDPGDPVTPRVEMAVVAVEVDGAACADRLVSLTGIGVSEPVPDYGFTIHETFAVRLQGGGDYVAFLPAFFYRIGGLDMRFSGIETPTENLSCIKSVSAVTEFRKDDVLFDYFIPAAAERLNNSDLFRYVRIRRLGMF